MSRRSRQQFLIALFEFAVAGFRFVQGASFLSQTSLQIANSFLKLDRHARGRGRLFDQGIALFNLVREKWSDLLNFSARSVARVDDKIFRPGPRKRDRVGLLAPSRPSATVDQMATGQKCRRHRICGDTSLGPLPSSIPLSAKVTRSPPGWQRARGS